MPGPARTVLFLHSSAGRYGADRQLALLTGGLDPGRYRPLVILAEPGPLAGDLRAAGVETHVVPIAVLRRALMTPTGVARVAAGWARDTLRLGRLARTRGVCLVHSNTSVTLGGAGAAAVARVPHVWHVREIYSEFGSWWPAYRRLLETADALPCVSAATRAQFGSDGRARVIADGVTLGLAPGDADPGRVPGSGGASRTARRAAARSRLGVPEDAFTCTVLGRLSGWKGQEVLLRALADPALAGTEAWGLIAGEPWRGQAGRAGELRELARAIGVASRTRFVGFVADVQTLYAASDVVVVPSTRPDPLPNAALEAAAAGCCVVASDHGGLPEIISDGLSGRLVRPADPGELARVLAELAADPDQRARLGAQAAADVRGRFDAGLLVERVMALYDELLS